MTKTLYDPAVEQKGIEKGIDKAREDDAINFLKLGVNEEIISKGTGLTLEKIIELEKKMN